MVYVNIGNRNLFTKPEGMDVFKYKEFDPKTTWYYRNVVHPKEMVKATANESVPTPLQKQPDKEMTTPAEDVFNEEKGRPPKRSRIEDTSESSMVE
jgi:hypothetical protein